jgi:hydrogenase maturation protein HypF
MHLVEEHCALATSNIIISQDPFLKIHECNQKKILDHGAVSASIRFMDSHKKIRVRGIVQGVGFRPFIFGLAERFNISGFVLNDTEGVCIEAHGEASCVSSFISAIDAEAPELAHITGIDISDSEAAAPRAFSIKESAGTGRRSAFFSPDTAVCADCLREFFDPADRRYHYPFITCIHCGPRFSIIRDIPYDRANTSMDAFPMCPECLAEYSDPKDRRFHAQPAACPACGPALTLRRIDGAEISRDTGDIARRAVEIIRRGGIVAMKGIGGYLLAADAVSDAAVANLRERKRRPFKPFAVMASTVQGALSLAEISQKEEELLVSKERPIVLLKAIPGAVSPLTAPGMSYIGIMLPYLPFQHLLFNADPSLVLIMTSGNIAEEPIIYADEPAFKGFAGIADYIISYNRDIIAQNDDSVLFVEDDAPCFVRRSRGYVPRPFSTEHTHSRILAAGGDLKNAFALSSGDFTIVSQHLGDMAHPATQETFKETLDYYMRVFDIKPDVVVSDMHPSYMTTHWCDEFASSIQARRVYVQHHHAHIASVIEEYKLPGKVLGIAFDGTGYGTDGTLWGSEFLIADRRGFTRAAHFSDFPLPGGEKAVKDVWRIGLALLLQACGKNQPKLIRHPSAGAVAEMIEKNINSPGCCSIGRLFDGVSALLGIRETVSSEAEAAVLLEEAARKSKWNDEPFIIPQNNGVIETAALTRYILDLIEKNIPAEDIARAFHASLAYTALSAAEKIRQESGINTVALSGGAFHNRILFSDLKGLLIKSGFDVFFSRILPFNDGCISYGQAAAARELLK